MAVTWTDAYVGSSAIKTLTASNLANLQSDLEDLVHGNLTNSNVASGAAIQERKIAFDTGAHDHGTDSTPITATLRHWRHGCRVTRQGNDTIRVSSGTVSVGGTMLTVSQTDLTVSDTTDWVSGSETANEWVYVTVASDSGTPDLKLTDSSMNVGYTDDNTTEYPLRYRSFSGTYHRYLGNAWNDPDSNILAGTVNNFDLTNVVVGGFRQTYDTGGTTDYGVVTMWTPKLLRIFYSADTAPVATDRFDEYQTTLSMLDDLALNVSHEDTTTSESHFWVSTTVNGTVDKITKQSASTAGSFSMDTLGYNSYVYWIAYTDNFLPRVQ